MDQFLERHKLPKLTPEAREIFSRLLTAEEIEIIVINFLERKPQAQMFSLVNTTKHLKKNSSQSFTNFLTK